MADDLIAPGGSAAVPGQGPSAVPSSTAASLASLLKPGDVVSGRVIQSLGSDQYLLTVRGATMVVSSQVDLSADSVVRFQVLNSGAQITLRMVDASGGDQAQTSTSAARLQALGLPPTSANTLALAAFEQAGAPLAREPLQAAANTLSATTAGASAPAEMADALAVLARDGLPATPATIALALRALSVQLPDPAGALPAVQRALATLANAMPATVSTPGSSAAASTNVPSLGEPGLALPAAPGAFPTPASASGALASTTGPAGAGVTAEDPGTSSVLPSAVATPAGVAAPLAATSPANAPPSPSVMPEASATDAAPAGPATVAADASGPGVPVRNGPAIVVLMPALGTEVPATDGHASASPGAATAALSAITTATTTTSLQQASQASGSNVSSTAALLNEGPLAAPVGLASTPLQPGDLALRTLLAQGVPDATQDGVPAVMQALAWAGLRSSAGPAVAGSLLKHLAAALPAAETSSTAVPASLLGKARDDLTQTLVQAVRETSAMTVIKPSSMDDYDVVMGVPLQDQGQSTPTRLAVAARPAPGGTTTFLRVDTELSHMGRISVRISGLNEGPMAITLLADGGGGRALAEALPDLADSLHQLGLVAGLRVASLSTEDGYG